MSPGRELVERIQRTTLAWQAIVTILHADRGPRAQPMVEEWVMVDIGRSLQLRVLSSLQVRQEPKLPGPPPKLKVGPRNFHVIPRNDNEKIEDI